MAFNTEVVHALANEKYFSSYYNVQYSFCMKLIFLMHIKCCIPFPAKCNACYFSSKNGLTTTLKVISHFGRIFVIPYPPKVKKSKLKVFSFTQIYSIQKAKISRHKIFISNNMTDDQAQILWGLISIHNRLHRLLNE